MEPRGPGGRTFERFSGKIWVSGDKSSIIESIKILKNRHILESSSLTFALNGEVASGG